MAGCCNCLNPGPQQSYIATVQGPDLEQAHSSQVQGTCDTNQEPVTGQVGKKSHSGLKAQLTTLLAMGPTARQNSIELSGMGFTRQSSRYDYGFTKDYLSGNIKFLESKKAHKYTKSKYLAIQPDENPDVVVSALSKKWGLDFPKLLISILGGGEEVTKGNYAMKKAFCKGLVEAVLSTDVWLFTGGLNCGMMKRMGQALTNYAIGRAMVKHRDVVAVGVASLGIVSQKEKLLGSERMPVMYNMDGDSNNSDNEGDGDYDCRDDASAPTHHLEPNHTHFILVGNTDSKLGDEVGIRNELVHMIAKCKIKGSNATVPALHVVFGGDHSTIQTVNDAVTKHQIPVLVIPDSGGAADVLTFAINSRPQTGEDNIAFDVKITHEIKMKLSLDPKCFVKTKDLIKEIIKRRHLINVCDQDFRIDEAILRALMNANRGCKAQDDLHLAVIWNRIDLAKKELLAHRKWKHSELRDSFYYALVNNQPKLVKLFIAEGDMDVKKFLTAQMLVDLYNETSQESYVLHSLLEKQRAKRHFRGSVQFSLEDVGHVLKELVFDTYESDYSSSHFRCSDAVFFKQPLQELFLWAVLLHRFRMAKLFWKLGKPSIGGALLASKILRALSELQKQDPQESAEMHKHAKDFQTMAIDFLNLCYTGDRRRTSLLLVRNLPDWGNSTCLDLAAAARNKQFIAHAAVQNLLNELWMGRLSLRTGLFKIWTSIFFPFLICCVVTFMSKEDPRVPARRKLPQQISKDSSGNRETHDDLTRSKSGCQTTSYQTCNTDDADDTGSVKTYMTHVTYRQHEEDGLPCWYKMKLFYEAPVISFRLNMISHFLFLGLFSYILLCNFTEEVSIYEMVLMGWVFTLFTEEVRQIFQEDYQTVYHRFDAWLWGYWNCMDLLSLVMFAVGVGLRFHPVTLDAARIILALDLVVFYLRILHIFSASKLLGPKLIMIVRMLVLLVAFLAILLVFLVAFGVACQAILFPNNQDIVSIIKGVFYQSYFQLYGELFLEDIDSEECALLESANVGSMQRCPQHSWFGTLILAFYLFISNILLLNLLIAMLNYTFQAIQDNTDTFWKFQRYQLVKEYYQRPSVVPPLIIVMHVYQMIRWAWDKCFPRCTLYRSANLMKRKLQQDKQIEISTWEEVTGEDYLAEQKKLTNRESHKRMKQTDEKLEALSSKMTKHFEGARLNKAIEGRFNMLEAQIANLECLVNSLHGTGLSSDSSDGLTRAGHLQSLRHHMESYPPKKGKSAYLK